MKNFFACLCLLLGVSNCGGTSQSYIDNPYENQMKDFTHMGVKAMHEERWKSAEHSFSRALQMAQLLSDPALEARAWYNDAMAWKAMGHFDRVREGLEQALRIARKHGLSDSVRRAQIQWILLHDGKGELPKLEKTWPADVALSLGYALTKKKLFQLAEQAYMYVLRHAKHEKSGLLLQARAMLGLAFLLSQVDSMVYKPWAEEALKLFRQVGAPQKTAQALLMIASDKRYHVSQRRDAAMRAETVYHILQDKHGEALAKASLQSMALLEGGEHE